MSASDYKPESDDMQRFSATGRPYKARNQNDAMNNVMFTDSFAAGQGPPNLLPFKYTDDSIIQIPVLPPGSYGKTMDSDLSSLDSSTPLVKEQKKGGFLRRLSSQGKKDKKDDFIMKGVKRGDYLKHYAKDDNGVYIGTEEPAPDCILKGADLAKYRGGLK